MGMVGTALSAFFTPRFVRWFGLFTTHVIIAVALNIAQVALHLVMRGALPRFSEHRSCDAEAGCCGQAAGDLEDGVPVRSGLRWIVTFASTTTLFTSDDLQVLRD